MESLRMMSGGNIAHAPGIGKPGLGLTAAGPWQRVGW
jgi:hypothetical protein